MKNLASLLVAMALVVGCDDSSDAPVAPSGFLYGVSFIEGVSHFVTVDAATGTLIPVRALPDLVNIKGQAAINTHLRHYYITSLENLFVIDMDDGTVIRSFPLENAITQGIVYNTTSKKLNAISTIDGLMHLVEIDPDNGSVLPIRSLQGIAGYSGASSSITRNGSKYYFLYHHFLYSVDTRDGSVSLPFESQDNIGVMHPRYDGSEKADIFFGMNLSVDDHHFFLYHTDTREVKRLADFEGGLSGGDMSLDDTGTFAFYMGDYQTVHGVNMGTGETQVTHRLPYQSGNLVWARY